MTLSKALGLSPQNTSLILRGINNPNAETTLQISELLESQNMKTDFLDPRTETRVSTRTRISSHPRTLIAACETIEALEAELAQLKTVPTTPAAFVPTPARSSPAPKSAPQLPAARTATPPSTAWERELVRAHEAATADLSCRKAVGRSIAECAERRERSGEASCYLPVPQRTPAQFQAVEIAIESERVGASGPAKL